MALLINLLSALVFCFGPLAHTIDVNIKLSGATDQILYIKTDNQVDSCYLKAGIAKFTYQKKNVLPEAINIFNKSGSITFGFFVDDVNIDISGSVLNLKT